MLMCEHCESPRFLEITSSTMTVDNDAERVLSIREELECQTCGLEGAATFDLERETVTITGGLVRTPERPHTVGDAPLRGGV